jgi:Lrp/AsnC family leucine-responsive transcriptional regulator
MDALDRKIIEALLADARIPYARMAEELGLATATVHQRVRRLRESGVITGYTARLDWSKLDLPLAAVVSISVTSRRPLSAVAEYLRQIPWVVACAAVSGQFDLLVHVRAAGPAHLGEIIDDIRKASKGATQTVLVLSPYFDRSAPVAVEPTDPVSDG